MIEININGQTVLKLTRQQEEIYVAKRIFDIKSDLFNIVQFLDELEKTTSFRKLIERPDIECRQ